MLPVFERPDDADRRASTLCRKFCADVGWPSSLQPVPRISTASQRYYWTVPLLGVILIHPGEEQRLLGLPDLAHELAHFLVEDPRIGVWGDLAEAIDEHVRTLPVFVNYNAQHVRDAWKRWRVELACDMAATFMVGPAYGWQHLRLSCGEQRTLFEPVPPAAGHPADAARMRAICLTLETMELSDSAERLSVLFSELGAAMEQKAGGDYKWAYPDAVLVRLADTVSRALVEVGMVAWRPGTHTEGHVPALLNQAWDQFHENPDDYLDWERAALERLWSAIEG